MHAAVDWFKNARLTHALVFSFPLFGNSIKSWTGVVFVLLLVHSLTTRPWKQVILTGRERRIMWAFVLIFLSIVISGLANGWSENQTRGLGVYIRFLAAIPICILLIHELGARRAFALGSAAAALILACQSLYEVVMVGGTRAIGVYESPGLVAGQAMVFGIVSLLLSLSVSSGGAIRTFGFLGFVSSLLVIVLSGSRASYLSFLLTSVSMVLILVPKKMRILILVVYSLLLLGLILTGTSMAERFLSGFHELIEYLEDDNVLYGPLESVGQRIEMWKVALVIFMEQPLFGAGWRSFAEASNIYVERGLVHPLVGGHPHPHSTYLEFLTSSGMLGLSSLGVLFYAFSSNVRRSNVNALAKNCAITFILLIVFMGINEGGLFVYGNSLSFYLVSFGFFMAISRRGY